MGITAAVKFVGVNVGDVTFLLVGVKVAGTIDGAAVVVVFVVFVAFALAETGGGGPENRGVLDLVRFSLRE